MLDLRQTESFDSAFGAYKHAWFVELHRIAGEPLDAEDWIDRFTEGLTPLEAWRLGPSGD